MRRIVWNIYAWPITFIIAASYIHPQDKSLILIATDIMMYIAALTVLHLHIWDKKLFSKSLWKIFPFIFIIWDLLCNIILIPMDTGESFDPKLFFVPIILLPLYISLFRYGFRKWDKIKDLDETKDFYSFTNNLEVPNTIDSGLAEKPPSVQPVQYKWRIMKILKNTLIGLGILFILIISFIAFMVFKSSNFKDDYSPFVTNFIATFSKEWQIDDIESIVTSECFEQLNTQDGKGIILSFKRLGKLQKINDIKLDQFRTFAGSGSYKLGIFLFEAEFENASTLVRTTVIVRDGEAKVQHFRIVTTSEIKNAVPKVTI